MSFPFGFNILSRVDEATLQTLLGSAVLRAQQARADWGSMARRFLEREE